MFVREQAVMSEVRCLILGERWWVCGLSASVPARMRSVEGGADVIAPGRRDEGR